MKPSDIFGIIVRTIGVLLLLYGLWYLVFAVAEVLGIVAAETPDEAKLLFLNAASAIVVALTLMRAASWFVRFSYPDDNSLRESAVSSIENESSA